MHIVNVLAVVVALFVLAALHGCKDAGGAGSREAEKAYSVSAIELVILRTNPPKLQIHAKGQVRTGGWTKSQLKQFVYIQPPPDGIYEFDFLAVPPTGAATQAITDINMSHVMAPMPVNLKGVRIYTTTNMKEALLGSDN